MDDTACSDEEHLGAGPSPAASGSDRRTVARRPEAPRPDPLGATVVDGQGFDLPVVGVSPAIVTEVGGAPAPSTGRSKP